MSVPDQETANFYEANGITTTFPYGFYLLTVDDLVVSIDGEVLLNGYTVTGVGNKTGGSVIFSVAPVDGANVLLERAVALERVTDYQPNGDLRSDVLNTDFDRIWMVLQDKRRENVRSLRYPNFENLDGLLPNAATRALHILGFAENGVHTMLPMPATFGAGDMRYETFSSGTHFTPGVTTSLTLARDPGSPDNLVVFFDGTFQAPDQWSVAGSTLNFGSPIPVGVSKVFVRSGTTLSVFLPPPRSVGDDELSWATVLSRAVDSIDDLRTLNSLIYKRAFAMGYYAPLDDGGGTYVFDPSDTTSVDNGGTIIVALDGARWKLKRDKPISFKQFGAKFDGVTDDTARINAALAGAGPGVLFAPAGTCVTDGNHTIGAGQYIVGAGQGSTIFSCPHLTNDIFKITSTYSGISDCSINGAAARSAGRHIFNSAGAGPTHISNVSLANCFVGIELNGTGQYVKNAIIVDSTAPASPLSYGIHISGGNDQIIDGVILNCGSGKEFTGGLAITQCEAAWVTNCDFIHAKNGVLVAPSGTGFVRFLFFENVASDTATDNAWYFLTAGTATISSCSFTNCWGASAANQGLLAQGNGGAISGLSFSNTRMVNNGLDGMYFQNNVRNVVLNGGLISGNSQTSPASSYGIHIGTNQNDFAITGLRIGPDGHFADTQLAQIRVDPGSGDRISIVGCDLNTAHTPVDMLGSGSNNTISGCTGGTLKGRISTTTDGSGHITVTHNMGTIPTTILATVENDGSAIFVQASGVRTTTNFQLKFYNASGAALANTAVSFSWMIDF